MVDHIARISQNKEGRWQVSEVASNGFVIGHGKKLSFIEALKFACEREGVEYIMVYERDLTGTGFPTMSFKVDDTDAKMIASLQFS